MSTHHKNISIEDVMLPLGHFPVVGPTIYLKEALEEMGRSRLGIICITNNEGRLAGILTDGDIRRKLLKIQKPFSAFFIDDVIDHAIQSPITIRKNEDLRAAVNIMEEKQVWDLPVLDEYDKLIGLLHLHPALKALL